MDFSEKVNSDILMKNSYIYIKMLINWSKKPTGQAEELTKHKNIFIVVFKPSCII
jgi:hypothetical protein